MIASLLRGLFGGGEQVGTAEALARINRGAFLVDVREPGEYDAGHAAQALSLPLGRIRRDAAAALAMLNIPAGSEVLLICASGMRSRSAQSALAADPSRRYVNVAGGTSAWAADGLPMRRGAGRG